MKERPPCACFWAILGYWSCSEQTPTALLRTMFRRRVREGQTIDAK